MVDRTRLRHRLTQGLYRKLSLITAGAGWGKSSLVADWVADLGRPVWLSLEAADEDPGRFFRSLGGALAETLPEVGRRVAQIAAVHPRPDVSGQVDLLVQALASAPGPVLVVFDDWHLLGESWAPEFLTRLLALSVPTWHWIVVTREPVGLPLAVLRARDQITELTTEDLRFSASEVAEFLTRVMGLSLSAKDEAALAQRTEGWVAGLQLAALGLQRTGPRVAVESSGDLWAAEFLVSEVLNQQSEAVRRFLLATCVTERVSVSLAQALVDVDVTASFVERIVADNLFLTPVGTQGWYRYHALFLQMLRRQAPEQHADLHRRASRWFEAHGWEEEAFVHAARAGDIDRAEALIGVSPVPLSFRSAAPLVRAWLEDLSDSQLDPRPTLRIARAQLRLFGGQPDRAGEDARRVTALLDTQPDTPATRNLRGQAASLSATLAILTHDLPALRGHSERALELLDPSESALRSAAAYTLGYALQLEKRPHEALEALGAVLKAAGENDGSIYTLAALVSQGQVYEDLGDDRLALASFHEVIRRAGDPPQRIACEAFLGLGRLALKEGRPDEAQRHADRGRELTSEVEGTDTGVSWALLQAELWDRNGKKAEAIQVLNEAEALVKRHGFEFRRAELVAARSKLVPSPSILLSPREAEVLELVAQGLPNLEVANRLFVSLHTVKVHLKHIFGKLEVSNRTEAVVRYRAHLQNTPPNTSFE